MKPFLKYPGGKGKLVNLLNEFTLKNYTAYYECFIGGGANLFFLKPELAIINDINSEVINCYKMIRDRPEKLIELCQDSRYEIVEIQASRSINSNSQKRGKTKELLIYSKYEL